MVRRVTENQGKRTPGVDGVAWKTPEQKAAAMGTLRQRGYRPQPLRRVYIAKSNGKRRGWGFRVCRTGQCRHCIGSPWTRSRKHKRTRTLMDFGPTTPQRMPLNSAFMGSVANFNFRGVKLKISSWKFNDLQTTKLSKKATLRQNQVHSSGDTHSPHWRMTAATEPTEASTTRFPGGHLAIRGRMPMTSLGSSPLVHRCQFPTRGGPHNILY
jgi:N-terminal domain of reverse transcriptase